MTSSAAPRSGSPTRRGGPHVHSAIRNRTHGPGAGRHAGVRARQTNADPLEAVPQSTLAKFTGTTNESAITKDSPTSAERAHYFDIGVTQKILEGWNVGLDGFYKSTHSVIDEGQFGQALILPRPSTKIDIFSIQRNAQQSPETRKTSFARHCGTCSLWYCVNPSIVSDVGRLLESGRQVMSDDSAKSRLDISEVGDITRQLNDGHLSRHGLRERLTALGVGFGAAFMLVQGDAGTSAILSPRDSSSARSPTAR